jgi:hypothetical protein
MKFAILMNPCLKWNELSKSYEWSMRIYLQDLRCVGHSFETKYCGAVRVFV